jgi:tetratricopeptide (TPR) repeat protein
MGKERTPAGKFFYFFSAGLIFFLLIGFIPSKEKFVSALEQKVSPRKVPQKEEPPKPTVEDLSHAKALFDLGSYIAALEENERILSRSAKNGIRGQALFNIGLIYAHVENPQRNSEKALQAFKAVIKEYPRGPLTGEAKVLVGVLQEKEKLTRVIGRLKRENEGLSQLVEKLKREKQELNRMIDKFKQVDIDVEQKKKIQER